MSRMQQIRWCLCGRPGFEYNDGLWRCIVGHIISDDYVPPTPKPNTRKTVARLVSKSAMSHYELMSYLAEGHEDIPAKYRQANRTLTKWGCVRYGRLTDLGRELLDALDRCYHVKWGAAA